MSEVQSLLTQSKPRNSFLAKIKIKNLRIKTDLSEKNVYFVTTNHSCPINPL